MRPISRTVRGRRSGNPVTPKVELTDANGASVVRTVARAYDIRQFARMSGTGPAGQQPGGPLSGIRRFLPLCGPRMRS